MKQFIRLVSDVGPLGVFFLVYKFYGLIYATGALIGVTIVITIITFLVEKRVSIVPLVSAVLLSVFGSITIISGNPIFIKIKPTLLNILIAIALFVGVYFKKPLFKYLMESAIKMDDQAWLKYSARWAYFFLFLAGVNEFIWRNFPEAFWVNFKVFGMLPLTITFMLCQLPFLKKHAELPGTE